MARFVQQGSRAVSISLSYGERQESGRQWTIKGKEASLEDMKKIKEEECIKSAEAIGGCWKRSKLSTMIIPFAKSGLSGLC